MGKAKKRDLIECLYHLPVLQVFKLIRLLKEQFKAINELEEARKFQTRVKPLIKQSKSMEENNEWSPARLKQVASLKIDEKDFKELSRLIKKKHRQVGYFNGIASLELFKLVEDEVIEKEKVVGEANAAIQYFRIMEAFFESAPQFILQSCAIIQRDPLLKELDYWMILTLTTSFFSLLMTMITVFLQMPHLIDDKQVAPFQCMKNYLVVGPVMFFVVTPRLLILSIFFATIRYGPCVVTLAVILTLYSTLFWSISPTEYLETSNMKTSESTERNNSKTSEATFLSFSWLTSIFGPCIVIKPKSSLISFSCILSAAGYLMLLVCLELFSYSELVSYAWNVKDNSEFENQEMIKMYRTACWILFVAVILTSLVSAFLLEENRQLISLKLKFGPVCCPFDEQFHWACQSEYEKLIKHYLKSGKDLVTKANNIDGLTGFQYSYVNKIYLAMEMMITHPSFLNAKSEEVGCIFEEVCFRGNVEVVQILLKHRDSKYIITAKDGEDKTGFIRACQMGREEVALLLANHPGSKEMFPIKDGQSNTGFMNACCWGKFNVVRSLLDHPYYNDLFKKYLKDEQKHMTDAKDAPSSNYTNDVKAGYILAQQNKKRNIRDLFEKKMMEAWGNR